MVHHSRMGVAGVGYIEQICGYLWNSRAENRDWLLKNLEQETRYPSRVTQLFFLSLFGLHTLVLSECIVSPLDLQVPQPQTHPTTD